MDKKAVIGICIVGLIIIGMGVLFGVQYSINHRTKITPPESPTDLRTTTVSASQIAIAWNDNSKNEVYFIVYRDGDLLEILPENTESFIDNDVQYSTNYQYQIVAQNSRGESKTLILEVKTKNPPLTIKLIQVGVADNGEDLLREMLDNHGEVYVGIVVTDGSVISTRRLPSKGEYLLADNSVETVNQVIYSTQEVGDRLKINVVGFEKDGGLGEELLSQAFDMAVKGTMNTLASLMLDIAGVSFADTFKEIIGFDDDFLGEYSYEWDISSKWGVGTYYGVNCDKGNGVTGLRLWFEISSPLIGQ